MQALSAAALSAMVTWKEAQLRLWQRGWAKAPAAAGTKRGCLLYSSILTREPNAASPNHPYTARRGGPGRKAAPHGRAARRGLSPAASPLLPGLLQVGRAGPKPPDGGGWDQAGSTGGARGREVRGSRPPPQALCGHCHPCEGSATPGLPSCLPRSGQRGGGRGAALTKPYPRDLPVCRSVITTASSMSPKTSKYFLREESVVW